MAKLPASILKQLSARAKERANLVNAMDESNKDTPLLKAHKKTGNYYLMYEDAIRSFLVAGYDEKTADKYINIWKNYDLIDVWYLDKYKLIGFSSIEIERAMV